jgi:hypothetical protein
VRCGVYRAEIVANCNRYFEAAKLNQKLDRLKDALECAERGLRIDRDCLGSDHPLHEQSLKVVQDLRQESVKLQSNAKMSFPELQDDGWLQEQTGQGFLKQI